MKALTIIFSAWLTIAGIALLTGATADAVERFHAGDTVIGSLFDNGSKFGLFWRAD